MNTRALQFDKFVEPIIPRSSHFAAGVCGNPLIAPVLTPGISQSLKPLLRTGLMCSFRTIDATRSFEGGLRFRKQGFTRGQYQLGSG